MAKRGLYANIHAKRKRIKAGSGNGVGGPPLHITIPLVLI